MPAAPIIPKVISFTLQVGAGDVEEFNTDILDAAVVPTPGAIQTVRTLDGVTHQDAESESWAVVLRTIQDWDTSRPGLASYLFTNRGETATFVLELYDATVGATAPALNGTCTLVAIPYGGPGNTFVEASVTLPMDGAPTVDTTP
jgi:hypothetical protein